MSIRETPATARPTAAATARPTAAAAFRAGAVAGLPFVIVVLPFAMLFGVVATEAGMPLAEAMTLSALVIAGASQFAFVQQISDGAPVYAAILTALAVNMRMAMYSASLTPHLGRAPLGVRAVAAYFMVDQVYALSIRRYLADPEAPLREKLAYYFGVGVPTLPFWYLGAFLGALFGAAIPPGYSLDFAVPVAYIAIAAPMLRRIPDMAAALAASIGALALGWAPYGTGLLIAAGLGIAVGYAVETALEGRS